MFGASPYTKIPALRIALLDPSFFARESQLLMGFRRRGVLAHSEQLSGGGTVQ